GSAAVAPLRREPSLVDRGDRAPAAPRARGRRALRRADGDACRRARVRSRAARDTGSGPLRPPGGIFLLGVRRARLAPPLRGWPRRARRRPPEGRLRSRDPDGGGRPPLPGRVLPPAPRPRWLAARVLGARRL